MAWDRARNPDPTVRDATPTAVDIARQGPMRRDGRVRRRCPLTTGTPRSCLRSAIRDRRT
jgi:hypothetical protein